MFRVRLEQGVVLIGARADAGRKPLVGPPELGTGEMPHSSRARPARNSASASAASRSSLPALASRSILRSKWSASNASNQARNFASSSGASFATAFSMSSMVMAKEYHSEQGG